MGSDAIVLVSGGLDSFVSIKKSGCNIRLGLIFDYGQVAFKEEKKAALKIAKYYGFEVKEIKLGWLKDIISNGLTSKGKIYDIKDFFDKKELEASMKSVWVPNRNALFINIAASYCEVFGVDKIIIGANKEEGEIFKDNSKDFIKNCNKMLKSSCNSEVEVFAPLIDMTKAEILSYAIDNNLPLDLVYSCYKGGKKHCGVCESCLHFKKALEKINRHDLIKNIF